MTDEQIDASIVTPAPPPAYVLVGGVLVTPTSGELAVVEHVDELPVETPAARPRPKPAT